jgi:hypothetical protein
METSLIDGELAYRQHSGAHTPAPNWPTFLTFAIRYIKGPGVSASVTGNPAKPRTEVPASGPTG